jgi:hypothetical protein
MARRSLKPQLNQIRAWVRQGRTDAWIAHQLEVSAAELRQFREQHDLAAEEEFAAATVEEAAEEEEEPVEAEEPEEGEEEEGEEPKAAETKEPKAKPKAAARAPAAREGQGDSDDRARRRRRRGRRGGRGRRKELEATFDHGERDGYGLWLDASVKDNPVYTEHWAGKREVTVRIEADQIVIRRAGSPEPDDSDE